MAVTIEDLRNEELFREWSETDAFTYVANNNETNAVVKLWLQAKAYSIRIAGNYTVFQVGDNEEYDYQALPEFIIICKEIEQDSNHDRWWRMTMRAVLFTMISTFCFRDYLLAMDELKSKKSDVNDHMLTALIYSTQTEYNKALECLDPECNSFDADEGLYDDLISIIPIAESINRNVSDDENPYLNYNGEDYVVEEDCVEPAEVETSTETAPVISQEHERDEALKTAIEKAMKHISRNRHWFSILKVLVIHDFAINISSAAQLVKSIIGEEELAVFGHKIDVDDLNKLNIYSFQHEVSKWRKQTETMKTRRFDAYKRIAELFEQDLLKAGLIEQAK